MSTAQTDDKGVILVCPNCGQKNRTPYEHLGETGNCGKCKAALPPPAVPLDVTQEASFEALITRSPLPVLVDFWASWCGPCRMVAPEMEKVAAANRGKFLVAKVNTETLPALASRYAVQSIPMMIVFAGGRETARSAGARPAAAIESFVRQAVDAKSA